MPRLPTAAVAAGSLIAGYVVARETGVRPLGGVVLVAGGAWCTRSWVRARGPAVAGMLLAVCVGGFVVSHPLARRVGAWPAVLSVSAVSAAAAWTLADRRSFWCTGRGSASAALADRAQQRAGHGGE